VVVAAAVVVAGRLLVVLHRITTSDFLSLVAIA
jgi:hypothetical protein